MKLKYIDQETHDVRLKDSNVSIELIKQLIEKHMRNKFEEFKSLEVNKYDDEKNYIEIFADFDVEVEEDTEDRPYNGWRTEYDWCVENESSIIINEMEQAIKEYIDED